MTEYEMNFVKNFEINYLLQAKKKSQKKGRSIDPCGVYNLIQTIQFRPLKDGGFEISFVGFKRMHGIFAANCPTRDVLECLDVLATKIESNYHNQLYAVSAIPKFYRGIKQLQKIVCPHIYGQF